MINIRLLRENAQAKWDLGSPGKTSCLPWNYYCTCPPIFLYRGRFATKFW